MVALILVLSILMPSGVIIKPRYLQQVVSNSHLLISIWRPVSIRHFMTSRMWAQYSFFDSE